MIAILAIPAAWVASTVTSRQLDSSTNCTGDTTHMSCTGDGTFASVVVAVLAAVAAAAAIGLRVRFPHRRAAEWVPAVLWVVVVVAYLLLPAAG